MTHRKEQLGSTLMRELQTALARGLADPRIRGLVTLTDVEIINEGKTARVMVTVLPEEHEDLTLHGLRAAAGHLRRTAGERIRTRELPQLEFVVDRARKRESGVLDALAKARAEDEARGDKPAFPTSRSHTEESAQ